MNFHFGTDKITVNIAQENDLWREVRTCFAARDGFALATLNLDHLVKLSRSSDFRTAYIAQDYVVADGNPIVWMSRIARNPVELMPGSELIIPLAKIAAETGIKVGLVGSTAQVLADAAASLQRDIPGLEITAKIAPPFGFDPTGNTANDILEQLAAADVGLCFLALSAPKQEQFAAHGKSIAPSVGFVSIGAGLDFIAGVQTRAPRWVRTIAMEWAWRLLLSPRRLFARYASCIWILPRHMIASWRQR